MKTNVLCSILVVIFLAATAQGQDRMGLNFSPILAADDDFSTFAPGLEFAFYREREPCATCKLDRSGIVKIHGRVLTRPSLNSIPLVAEALGGGVLNFFEPPVYVRDANDPDARPVLKTTDNGRLNLSLQGRFQVSQDFLDHDLLGGIGFGYTNLRIDGIWDWVPSVVVYGQLVMPVKTEDRGAFGHDAEPFGRVQAQASLHPRVGALIGVERLVAHVSLDFVREIGTTDVWQENDLHQAFYIESSLGYEIGRPERYRLELFAGMAHGRIPPEVVEETIFRAGIMMGI